MFLTFHGFLATIVQHYFLFFSFLCFVSMEPKKRERNMSYRKPVPEYIPSPVPSPTAPLPQETEENTPADQEQEIVPPLPENWREILEAKASELERPSADVPPTLKTNFPITNEHEPDVSSFKKLPDLPNETPLDVSEEASASNPLVLSQNLAQPQAHRGRGLPTNYRPPTPPIRNPAKKKSLVSDKTSDIATLDSKAPSIPVTPPYPNYSRNGVGAASLRPSPSFRTENTLVSMNTSYSMGWPGNTVTGPMLQTGVHSSPKFLGHKKIAGEPPSYKPEIPTDLELSAKTNTCWPKQSFFNGWARRIRNVLLFRK